MKKCRFLLSVSLITIIVILSGVSNTALAYSGSDYTSNSSLAAKLDNLFNTGVAIFSNVTTKFKVGDKLDNSKKYYWASGSYYGWQCYAYGNAAYYYLFGDSPLHGGGGYSNSKLISGVSGKNTLSYNILVEKGVGCGAYIRTTTNSSGAYNGDAGHSMIILTYNESNITVLHGNAGGNGEIKVTTWTWDGFNTANLKGRSRYVSHIVQPNLTAGSITSQPATNLEFKNVVYPKVFKINSNGWSLSGGLLVSNQTLTSIDSRIIRYDGTVVSQMSSPMSISGNSFSISGLDGTGASDNGQKFSKVTTAGNYIWRLTAKDSSGRELVMDMPFTAVTGKSTSTSTMSRSYGSSYKFSFNNVVYPQTFKINTTNGWSLSGGSITCDKELKSISSKIVNSSGTTISGEKTHSITGHIFNLSHLDTYFISGDTGDNGVKFSKISSAGTYKWILKATDVSGRVLTLEMQFSAVSSGSTSTATVSRSYDDTITSVSLNKSSLSLEVGKNETLTATVSPSNAPDKSVSWTSSNSAVASVDSNGKVTANAAGTATITVTTNVGNKTAACAVTVILHATAISENYSPIPLEAVTN